MGDKEREYYEIERQITQLKESGLSQRERMEKKLELNKLRVQLLPYVEFSKGEEYAEVIEHDYRWDVGAPLPHVFSDGNDVFLAYILADASPDETDGESVRVLTRNDHSYDCALVHFTRSVDYRFGGVNDEVLGGYPLPGLDFYELHEVHNSKWIAKLQKVNAYHYGYDVRFWAGLKHYFFAFHDETFECIAQGYTVEVYHGFIRDVMKVAFDRVFK